MIYKNLVRLKMYCNLLSNRNVLNIEEDSHLFWDLIDLSIDKTLSLHKNLQIKTVFILHFQQLIMSKGLFEAMQKREFNARLKTPISPITIPVDPADSLVKQYLMKTKYSQLSHLGHWIKNRHLLNTLQDDVLNSSEIREEIISLFGGFKKMLGLILHQMFNLNYIQHQKLFALLTTLSDEYIYSSTQSPLISLHESCIHIIFQFLPKNDHINLQRCCTDLAIIGQSKASKATKLNTKSFHFHHVQMDTTYNIMTHFALISSNNILIKRRGLQKIRSALSITPLTNITNKHITAKYAKLFMSSGYIKHIIQLINMKSDDLSMTEEHKLIQSKALGIIQNLSNRSKSNCILLVADGFILKELDDFFRNNKFLKDKGIFHSIVLTINNLMDANPSYAHSLKIEPLIQFICTNILNDSWYGKIKALTMLNKIIHCEKTKIDESVLNKLIKIISILIKAFGKQMHNDWRKNLEVGDAIGYVGESWGGSVKEKVIVRFEPENECVVLTPDCVIWGGTIKAKYIKDEINPQLKRFFNHISHETIILLAELSKKVCLLSKSNKVNEIFDDDAKKNQSDYFKNGDIVTAIGLQKHKDWNDKMGKIVGSFNKSKQRWPVQLMDDNHNLLL
eukprot:154860_1